MNKTTLSVTKKRSSRHNLRRSSLLLVVPMLVGASVIFALASGIYAQSVAQIGGQRLATEGWQEAVDIMKENQPDYQRKFAYYQIKSGQTIEQVAESFSVSLESLHQLNPGQLISGVTIKLTPVEKHLEPTAGPNGNLKLATVVDDAGMLRVKHAYRLQQPIVTNMPELTEFLSAYKAIERINDKTYRIMRPISLDGDIRLDITQATVEKIELRSQADDVTCLCFDEAVALIDDVTITTIDPTTGQPDMDVKDGRSFIRMKNGRMDMLNSHVSYLGNGLRKTLTPVAAEATLQKEGGVYGVSWRISDDKLGVQTATGWVEGNTFTKNHFGTYSYGASGMMWLRNEFSYNNVYGLDPHDDSNNALIEGNVFHDNGTHGFIVSKRCNYNIIRNNTSYNNGLHGFMLHQDSAYNVIENNVSYGNVDNYVIYESNYNIIRDNVSYSPSSSHIRINRPSYNSYIYNNQLWGGPRGIFLYDGPENTMISGNQIHGVEKALQTNGANNTIFHDNVVDRINFDLPSEDRIIFGLIKVKAVKPSIPTTPPLPDSSL